MALIARNTQTTSRQIQKNFNSKDVGIPYRFEKFRKSFYGNPLFGLNLSLFPQTFFFRFQ